MARNAPAFQFYVDDFLGGTAHMSNEEVGLYMRLLCMQWSHRVVTDRHIRAFHAPADVVAFILAEKFVRVDGGYQNRRLEEVRELSRQRKQAASKGGSKTAANRQANGKQTVEQTGKQKGVAKLNPPTPSPTPTPTPDPSPDPTPIPGGEKNSPPPPRSVGGVEFVCVNGWDAWKRKVAPDAVTEQAQLDLLESRGTAEAIAIVRFSVSRTNCRNLITDGSHERKLKASKTAAGVWDD
jgi:uncharacterized protein YdaU (DUF1376 family)